MEKKRIFAWIGIILMVGMYVATFIFALGKSPFFQTMFLASVGITLEHDPMGEMGRTVLCSKEGMRRHR